MPELNGTTYDERTPLSLQVALEECRLNKTRVRLFYGDPETGIAWPEENDVCGTISRSMGPVRVPILVANSRSLGGHQLLDANIVAVLVRDHGKLSYLYRHPAFEEPRLRCCFGEFNLGAGYACSVKHWDPKRREWQTLAQLKSAKAATRYMHFMTGRRMAK